ncbi:hypothetical protein V6N13_133911 [Hibiscus sabdariffa]
MKSVISNKHSAKPKEEYVTDDSLSQTASCDEKAGVVEVKASLDEMVDDESSSIGSKRKEICDDKSDVNQELDIREFLKKTESYTTKCRTWKVRVYCRVRPLVPEQLNTFVDHIDERTISILMHSIYGKVEGKISENEDVM